MDHGKVGAAPLYPPVSTPLTDELPFDRLNAYWRALGVTDPDQVAALSEQALRRASELPETPGFDPLARAIIAAGELLDDWLAQVLDLPRQSRTLPVARAALLSGAVPDWPTALFAPPGEPGTVLERLRAAIAEPTPAPGPGIMPAQRIELFSLFAPLRRMWRWSRGLPDAG